MDYLAWLILLAPALSAVANLFWLHRVPALAAGVSITACALAFVLSLGVWFGSVPVPANPYVWISAGGGEWLFEVTIGWLDDEGGVMRLMLLVVTGVGLLVHIFSLGYMATDSGRARFFGMLSLFMLSMLGIVIADNLVMMFIFWELVGVSSYLLIGFWFDRPAAADASKKAFVVNRIGDFGFLLGIMLFWALTGSLALPGTEASSAELAEKLTSAPAFLLTTLGLLLFCGCVGKSAMVPLHVWLPDAMEGPTPVSALIHAATMVAAGVYMLVRVFFILELSPDALLTIAWIGAITCVIAALIAIQQDDIKRVLAYSTLSQLGYMVMAVGVAAPGAAMFHLTTHACFKALLFLGAGSIITALHHEQNIWKMGRGLNSKMPITFVTFLIGTLALTGCPGLAGFFSKDAIILAAGQSSLTFYWIGLAVAFLTAFYMFRLVVVAFFKAEPGEAVSHAKESSFSMVLPLIILAIPSVALGWHLVGLDSFLHVGHEGIHALPGEHAAAVGSAHGGSGGAGHEPFLLGLDKHTATLIFGTAAFALGAGLASLLYFGRTAEPLSIPALRDKLYFDKIYNDLIVDGQDWLARRFAHVDNGILGAWVVRGCAGIASVFSEILRLLQAGNLQGYAILLALGSVLVLGFALFGSSFLALF